ncbi:hypothetical protein CFIMG_005397RA [Ceratocystis fimbriata CBS 114723]|uniref:Uncharacterized protein n=1 Tax=Ceratocystis fimbriata CBS 114723 TaxID=1035309 RepID=A0A2C5X3F8_9PEZI|nr:hypothetical protein CFIMG_005397RA [Ceratocystis fimbriata CBS 114723]
MFAASISNVRLRPVVERSKVPPPTPVSLPPLPPIPSGSSGGTREHLVRQIQSIYRPQDIKPDLLSSIGLETVYDVSPEELLPDASYLPDFAAWDKLSFEDARELDKTIRKKLPNGHLGPGAISYLDRKKELGYPNTVAFRNVRRLPPAPGTSQPRLGNSYDFFRHLEHTTLYWDDPTQPESQGSLENQTVESADTSAKTPGGDVDFYRIARGQDMPNEARANLVNAFVKLIAYDFGGNTTAPRMEARLYMCSPVDPGSKLPPVRSQVSSACSYIFRSPTDRVSARAGIVEGPVAAVSARTTVSFKTEAEVCQDISREIIAAIIIAQHRDREGKQEKRFGEGAWWTTKPRWGGGTGGPIGREIDPDDVPGDKESAFQKPKKEEEPRKPSVNIPGMPSVKRVKKTPVNIYDQYRQIRPPSTTWDPKTRYQAIGRIPGAGYDDIFLVSGLFHHISIVRIRVPLALLRILEGATEQIDYSKLKMWRSKWYDLFVFEDRMEALRLTWGMMAYQVRDPSENVPMSDVA